MNRLATASAAVALLVSACATGVGDETPEPATTTAASATPRDDGRPDVETPDITSPDDGGGDGTVPQNLVDQLLDMASNETGVPVDEISVVMAESVTWSDGSLGCPEPGMGYTQALVPGFRVVLDVDGEDIHYHAGQDGEFFACENPVEPADSR